MPRFARALAHTAVLTAAVSVPLFFAVPTDWVFEPAKAALLRTLGLVAMVAMFAIWADRSGAAPAIRRTLLRQPLALAALAVWAAEVLSTITSVAPWNSLLGAYNRGQGLYTTTVLIALMFAAASLAARMRGVNDQGDGIPSNSSNGTERLAVFLAASAFPAALYGVIQRFGLDPLPWTGDVVTRVVGPAGASVMLAAHLAMVLPFTLWATVRAWRRASRGAGIAGQGLALAVWLVMLVVGVAGLILSASRGPLLGLAAGLGIAAMAWAVGAGRRRLAWLMCGAGMGVVLLVVGLNVLRAREVPVGATGTAGATGPAAPRSALMQLVSRVSVLERLSFALDPERSTTRVRMRLWEASTEAVTTTLRTGNPVRILLGFGPESMDRMWAPFYPPILAYDEPRSAVPDRAHNLVLDSLISGGLIGLLATLVLFTAAIGACMAGLGLLADRSSMWWWLVCWLAGALAGAGLAIALDGGQLRLAGPAGGLGLVAGLGVWLAVFGSGGSGRETARAALGSGSQPPRTAERMWANPLTGIRLAILAALISHLVDVQVSFEVMTTRMVFWLLIGLLVGQSQGLADRGDMRQPNVHRRPDAATAVRRWDAVLAAVAVGFTLVYDFAQFGLVAGGTAAAATLVVVSVVGVYIAVAGEVMADGANWASRSDEPASDSPTKGSGSMFRTWLSTGRMSIPSFGLVILALLLFSIVHIILRIAGRTSASDAWPSVVYTLLWYGIALWLMLFRHAQMTSARHSELDESTATGTATTPSNALGEGTDHRMRRFRLALAATLALAIATNGVSIAANALYKEGALGWQAAVAEWRAAGDTGRAESFLDRARERYELASRLVPWEPAYHLARAREEVERGDLLADRLVRELKAAGKDDAVDEYDTALLAGQAQAYAGERDFAFHNGIVQLDRAVALAGTADGAGPVPVLQRARSYRVWGDRTMQAALKRDRLNLAKMDFELLMKRLASRWPEVYDEAAVTAVLAGDPSHALTLTRQAVALDPYYVRAWRTAASAHAVLDDLAAAADDYALYFKDTRNASDLPALRAQLEVLAKLGRTADALAVARTITQLAPGDFQALADLAVLLDQSGDRAAALDAARRAAALAPGDAGVAGLVKRLEGGR